MKLACWVYQHEFVFERAEWDDAIEDVIITSRCTRCRDVSYSLRES